MENLNFTKEEIDTFSKLYPDPWRHLLLMRATRLLKQETEAHEETKTKLHALGPQPKEKVK